MDQNQNPQVIITKEMLQKTKRAYVQMDPGEQLKVFVRYIFFLKTLKVEKDSLALNMFHFSSSVAENYVLALMSGSKQVARAVLFLEKRQREAFFSELKKRAATNYIR